MMIQASNRRYLGFTLIELLIVVAVIAILAAIAAPIYRDFVVRSNRSDAIISLTELANRQEKHFSNELRYTPTISELNYPTISPNDFYSLTVAANASVGYVLTATPRNQQLQDDDDCQQFTLNGLGQRSATDSGGGDSTQECWNR